MQIGSVSHAPSAPLPEHIQQFRMQFQQSASTTNANHSAVPENPAACPVATEVKQFVSRLPFLLKPQSAVLTNCASR
jgi:hypothetical protein